MSVEFLHAMVRVGDIDAATKFFCDGLGLTEVRRNDYPQGKYTLVFLASPEDVTRSGWNGEGKQRQRGQFDEGKPELVLTASAPPGDGGDQDS